MTTITTTVIADSRVHLPPVDGMIHVLKAPQPQNIAAISFELRKKPHWQRYGDGVAQLNVRCTIANNAPGCWMELDALEIGDKSTRRTMITLDRARIVALRDACTLALDGIDAANVREEGGKP